MSKNDKVKINEDGTISIIERKTKYEGKVITILNEEEYKQKGLIKLGYWFRKNDREGKFTEQQKELLQKYGYILSEDKDKQYVQKIEEYIELLNQGYIPRANEKEKHFNDGMLINQYWKTNRPEIKEKLETEEKYKSGYEVAKQMCEIGFLSKEERNKKLKELGIVTSKMKYDEAKEEFDETSVFSETLNSKENSNARKIS